MTSNVPNAIFTIAVCNTIKASPAYVVLVPHTEQDDGVDMCELDGRYNVYIRGMTNGTGQVNIGAVAQFLRHVADHLGGTENDAE